MIHCDLKPDNIFVADTDTLQVKVASIPGIRPGKKTEQYLDYVVTRLLVLGSAYLAAVSLLPEILRSQLAIPFYFGGTAVLVVVSVSMDTVQQIQSHLLAHQYEGLIEKSQLRGKKRVQQEIDMKTRKPILHVSVMYPSSQGCLALAMPICPHPTNSNGVIVYDLRVDPESWIDLPESEIRINAIKLYSIRS